MDEKEKVLIENIEEYYELGIEAFIRKKYNSATTLFFKAIATLCDLYILKKEGIIPSSHSKIFKILKDKYSDLYKIADRDFPFYQDSYTKKMGKEEAQLLKEDAENLKKTVRI